MDTLNSPCFLTSISLFPGRADVQRHRHSRNRCSIRSSLSSSPSVAAPQWDISLKSPSKINLFLRILGKRKDGYHELASLFQAISLHDNLYVSVLDGDGERDILECSTPGVPTDEKNLVIQAFQKFREHSGLTTKFRARLDKRIPHAAGLGGGSGNAATALWAANKLTAHNFSDGELAEIGNEFGSDISFFFTNGSAYCTGRGDKMVEIDRLSPHTLYVIKPTESLSTRDVFTTLGIPTGATNDGADPRELLDKMKKGVMWADFVNDLERPAFKLVPRLSEIKGALYAEGFNAVSMSGSGTAFFAFGHPKNRNEFFEIFAPKYNVKIHQCMFACRRFPGKWYFEQPPISELRDEKNEELLNSL